MRDKLREKQNRLLALAKAQNIPDSLQLSINYPGSPKLHELRDYLFPEYEAAIDSTIAYLESQEATP